MPTCQTGLSKKRGRFAAGSVSAFGRVWPAGKSEAVPVNCGVCVCVCVRVRLCVRVRVNMCVCACVRVGPVGCMLDPDAGDCLWKFSNAAVVTSLCDIFK